MKRKLILAALIFTFIHIKVSAQVIDTVAQLSGLQAYTGNAGLVYVKDTLRGGLFFQSSSGTPNDGTVFSGTGGVFWNRSGVNGVYNVKWWGAKGDSITDDRTSIKNAIDYLGLIGGGTLYFPAATYNVAATSNTVITVGSNVTIQGSNRYKTKLVNNVTAAHAFFRVNGDNFHVTGLAFSSDLATTARGQIEIKQGNYINIDNCFFNGGIQGVQLNPDSNQTIRNVYISGNHFNRLRAAIVIGSKYDSVLHDSIDNVTIANNIIENGRLKSTDSSDYGDGIKTLKKCANINIVGNSISGNVRDGIDLFASGDRVNVQNNFIFNNGIKAIDIKSDVTHYPLSIFGYNGRLITINNNRFENNQSGIGITRDSAHGDYNYGIAITDNIFTGQPQNCINTNGRHILVSNNQFLFNGTGTQASYHVITMGNNTTFESVQNAQVINNTFINNGNSTTQPYAIYVGLYGADISIEQNKIINNSSLQNPYQKNGIYINEATSKIRLRGNTTDSLVTNYNIKATAGVDYEPVLVYDSAMSGSTWQIVGRSNSQIFAPTPLKIKGTNTGGLNQTVLQLFDAQGVRIGYIGDAIASAADSALRIASDAAEVILRTGGLDRLTVAKTGAVSVAGAITLGNGINLSPKVISGNYTILNSDNVIYINAINDSTTVNLPSATNGKAFIIKHFSGADSINIKPAGTNKIDNLPNYRLGPLQSVLLIAVDGIWGVN